MDRQSGSLHAVVALVRARPWRWLAGFLALAMIVVALAQLERMRSGLLISHETVGSTPVTIFRQTSAPPAPAVIIAHGFAGSRQLMQAYALTLAQAGYVAVAFDFAGHGRHPLPMSGDLDAIEGTTQRLMQETGAVTDFARSLPAVDGQVALLGHSMATDILVRQAIVDADIAATVAISMFSEAVTPSLPPSLLIITGQYEAFLREEALGKVRQIDPTASEGTQVGAFADGSARKAVVAPGVEHVGVLYSASGLREARAWLDSVFDRQSDGPVAATGGWILLLLGGIVLLAWPLSAALPARVGAPDRASWRVFHLAIWVPALATPLALSLINTRFLPVLVADYLAVHLFLFGLLTIGVLKRAGVRMAPVAWWSSVAFVLYALVIFGGALDRYVVSFMPHSGRLPIILALSAGALPFMLADSLLLEGGRAGLARVALARTAFFTSLAIAIAIDFERLFFLIMIMPIILLFFVVFGLIGGWVGRHTGSPAASGVAQGLILAWALGVTFPTFTAA